MKKIISGILFIVSAVLFSCYLPANKHKTEGAIRYSISYTGNIDSTTKKFMPQSLQINFKNDKLRFKLLGGLVGALKPAIIIDAKKGEWAATNPSGKENKVNKIRPADLSLVKTGFTESISGHKCNIYKSKLDNNVYMISAAGDLPFILNGTVLLEGYYLGADNKIPLKIIDNEKDFVMTYEADSISTKSQPDDLFW